MIDEGLSNYGAIGLQVYARTTERQILSICQLCKARLVHGGTAKHNDPFRRNSDSYGEQESRATWC